MKDIINNNKIKALAVGVALTSMAAGSLTSCSDYLEIEPLDMITLDKFWNEKGDVESVLSGCYSLMANYNIVSRIMVWGEFRSDNVVFTGNANDNIPLQHVLKEAITADNTYTSWGDFYTVINRCNNILKYAPQVASVDPSYTQSQLNADIAEATALRSLCYFYLIRTFRDVPFSREASIDDGQTYDLKATPFDEVLSNLISDLEAVAPNAIEAYPISTWTYSTLFNSSRITKWAIYSMLSEMYLWKGDYQNCVRYAQLVIDRKIQNAKTSKDITAADLSDFYGYPLIGTKYNTAQTYGRAFNTIFVQGNSSEGIFEISYAKKENDTWPSNGPFSDFFGGQNRSPIVKYSENITDKNTMVSKNNKKVENDSRFYENIKFSGKNAEYINKTTCQGLTQIKGSGTDFTTNSSWGSQYPTAGSDHTSLNRANVIVYRLTDIMLLQAEAYTLMVTNDNTIDESSEADAQNREYLDKAFELVDAVNRRSLMEQNLATSQSLLDKTSYRSKATMLNLVYEERQRELMFEGKRYYDLVRRAMRENSTEYLRIACMKKDGNIASAISNAFKGKMNAIFWPYNLNELKVNKNLVQNPAFGSGEASYK